MNTAAVAYGKLSPEIEKTIIDKFQKSAEREGLYTHLETRMIKADKQFMREPIEGEHELELNVPILSPKISAAAAFLTKTFLGPSSVFVMGSEQEQQQTIANQYNSLFTRFAQDFQWRDNFQQVWIDGVKYNLGAVECTWTQRKTAAVSNTLLPDGKSVAVDNKVLSGFEIKRLDMYNTFWDPTVDPVKISLDGDYAGYHEMYTSMRLHRFLKNLPASNNYESRLEEILSTDGMQTYYRIPNINNIADARYKSREIDWDTFLTGPSKHRIRGSLHEVSKVHMRIIPKDLGLIAGVPAVNTPQIWTFIIVDGKYVVYAERRTNAHDMLPIVITQPRNLGLGFQDKSLGEELSDIQTFASSMWSMELASMRRTIADRALYDEHMLDIEKVNNPNPAAKIPVRNVGINRPLSAAYYQIPYTDPALGLRAQIASQLSAFGDDIAGQNPVTQGRFVKGNKTDGQFEETINNAAARQVMMAISIEENFMAPIKHMLKSDTLQYQQPVKIFDVETKQMVAVDPAAMRNAHVDFLMADGLIGLDKILSIENFEAMLNAIATSPQLQAEYKLAPMFSYLAGLRNVRNLKQFEKSTAEKEQERQQALDQQMALERAKKAPESPTE